ncbi:MAG: amidohydrolase, partial [Beijerinckiaceae bacterium]
ADTNAGHNIRATVYVQCNSMLRADGPEEYRAIGETEFVNGVAAMAASGTYGPIRACAGIVGFADLLLGDGARPVLEAQIAAGNGRLRGIRNPSARHDTDPSIRSMPYVPPKGLLEDPDFRKGFAHLAPLGLSFDAWLYQMQIGELTALADAFPETTIVLDHCGGILGVGIHAGKRKEEFAAWRADIRALAARPNTCVKLGGLAMHNVGFGFRQRPQPPDSSELAQLWKPYIETCIEAFGVNRAMFESNFPVDKLSVRYDSLWNAFKRITAGASADEKSALYFDTAARVYRLDTSK